MLPFLNGRGTPMLQPGRRTYKPSSSSSSSAAWATRLALQRHARCHVRAQQAVIAPEHPVYAVSNALLPLMNGTAVRAHESSVSSIIVLHDSATGLKVVVSSSLDKTIAAWRLSPNQDSASHPYYCEVQKIAAPGGPIFSMAPARPLPGQPPPKPLADGKSAVPTIFCGNAAKEVVSWQPFLPSFNQFKLEGHTGWVRAVATYDKYLFSCGCNYLRQWDCTFATPKELNQVKLFTGDILAVAAGKGFVSTAGADGSLRSWSVDKASGAMAESGVREHAHEGRICGLLRGDGVLYSCGTDGAIRMWSQGKLELQNQALHAHGGLKVRCMALGGNGVLYTGGDDHMIRAWLPRTLEPLPHFEPMRAHSSAVRVLCAGKAEVLVSGDSEGYINFFQVPFVQLPEEEAEALDPFAHLFIGSTGSAASVGSMALDSECELDLFPVAAVAAVVSSNSAAAAAVAAEPAPPPPSTLTAGEFDASLSPTPSISDSEGEASGEDEAAGISTVAALAAAWEGSAGAGAPPAAALAAHSEAQWFDECALRAGDSVIWEDDGSKSGDEEGGTGSGDEEREYGSGSEHAY